MTQNELPADELCRDIQMKLPDTLWSMDPLTRYRRGRTHDDFATLDDEHYYLFGVIEVPLSYEEGASFTWGVWVEVDRAVHDAYLNAFQTPAANDIHARGRLRNEVPGYEDALGAEIGLRCREDRRPILTVLEGSLAAAQRDGLDLQAHRALDEVLFGGDDDDDYEDL